MLRVGPARTPAGVPAQVIAGAWGEGLRSIVLCTSTRGGYLRTTRYLVFQQVKLACTLGLHAWARGVSGGAEHGLQGGREQRPFRYFSDMHRERDQDR